MSDSRLTWEEAVDWLRQQPDKNDLVYHCYYDDPVHEAAERFSQSEEWFAVVRLLEKHLPGKVLDIGAGRGISSYAFAKSGCNVVALEPDSGDIVGAGAIQSLIDSTNLPIEIVTEYGETLPFPENTFDIVYGRAVLHHASDLQKLCQEATRVLKPGGVFLATREHVISRQGDLQKFLDTHALHFLYGGENAYHLDAYTSAISRSGLEIEKVFGPYDSVINFAPMTQEQFMKRIASGLKRFLGQKIAFWVARFRFIQKFYGSRFSSMSDVPGRHYTFLAFKA